MSLNPHTYRVAVALAMESAREDGCAYIVYRDPSDGYQFDRASQRVAIQTEGGRIIATVQPGAKVEA